MIDDYLNYLQEGVSKGKALSASVGTALAILAITYNVYKKAIDGAEKACKNTPDKQLCITAFKHRAYKRRIKSLSGKLADCLETNNPGKCRKYIRKTITSLRRRVK